MTMNYSGADIERSVQNAVREHWGLFLAEGILLLVLGLVAVVLPPLATLAATIIFGWLFLISGVFGLFATWQMRAMPGVWWSALSALLGIGAGLVLLAAPLQGALSLTLVLIAFFIVEGIASIMYAFSHRGSGRWVWLVLSGVIDLGLAAVILAGLPGTAIWALGLLVGINMVFGGVAMIAMALSARGTA